MTARLVETKSGLGLVDDDDDDGMAPLVIDLAHARRLSSEDDLLRALGRGKGVLTVVDATAGIGRDAAALALAGFEVTAIERSPLVQALWKDALARHHPPRLRFVDVDAVAFLDSVAETANAPDAVFLDPMYPGSKRKSQAQREMRILRAAVGDDVDVELLFAAARRAARKRVVIKRSNKAPLAKGESASWSHGSTRFDMYLRPA
ncbi:MAG: class I SAM-dependent methyltransferase [Deltaproteobacteria bacterium]|nr:class I SAM-dependent methyltransferase [Deltaproteobacteria bacterium]